MTTRTTSDEIFKKKSKVPQIGFTGSCETGLCISQKLWPSFCSILLSNRTLSNVKRFNKTPVSILSQYCIQTLKRLASNPIAISSPAVILCPLITVNYRSRFTRLCNSFIGKNVVSDKTYCSSSANENGSLSK